MGIKELGSFLQRECPEAIYNLKLNERKGKKCAVDVSLFLYKFKYSLGENFLEKFIELINRFKINDITPIFVFDGCPPKEKIETINERKDKKNEYKELVKTLKEKQEHLGEDSTYEEKENINKEIDKLNRKIIYVTKENISQLKYMLDLLNIKYIHKQCEADLINSKLCSEGLVDMVISEDMDHLTSGTKYLMRDFNVNNNNVKCYDLEKIKEKLGLSKEKWIELCILFGCDYIKRIKGLGTVSSYKYIKQNQDKDIQEILNIIKKSKNLDIPENYLEDFNKAKSIFLNESINVDENDVKTDCVFDNQKNNVIVYLKKYTKLSDRKIKNRVNNIFNE
jgi:flap endonuclease-1